MAKDIPVHTMTDREIAEETLSILRGFGDFLESLKPVIEQAGPMLGALQNNPMVKQLMRMG